METDAASSTKTTTTTTTTTTPSTTPADPGAPTTTLATSSPTSSNASDVRDAAVEEEKPEGGEDPFAAIVPDPTQRSRLSFASFVLSSVIMSVVVLHLWKNYTEYMALAVNDEVSEPMRLLNMVGILVILSWGGSRLGGFTKVLVFHLFRTHVLGLPPVSAAQRAANAAAGATTGGTPANSTSPEAASGSKKRR